METLNRLNLTDLIMASRAHASRTHGYTPLSTGSSCAAQRAVVEEHVHVAAARRRRTSRRAPARHVVLGHLHMQRWRTVRSRRTGELVRVQRADTRAVCEHAEAGTPARGDHVNSDVVQSVLHVSSVCQTRRALLSCARQDRPLTSGTGYVMCCCAGSAPRACARCPRAVLIGRERTAPAPSADVWRESPDESSNGKP